MTKLALRRASQTAALILCLAAACGFLFWGVRAWSWLPRLSPLVLLTTRIAARGWACGFAGAMLFVVLGLIWPRFFCGWVCPVGTLIDCIGSLWGPCSVRSPAESKPGLQRFVLLAAIGVAFAAVEVTGWVDPLSLLTRTVDASKTSPRDGVYPLLSNPDQRGFWGRNQVKHQIGLLAILVLLLAVGLTVRGQRTWCRTLCPLGALYGILARYALLRRTKRPACSRCGECGYRCKMGALHGDGSLAREELCIGCRVCAQVCPEQRVAFALRWQRDRAV